MAFHLITGVMGSGKSYMGTELCMQAWKEGAIVHTNLPLVMEEVERNGWTAQTVLLPKKIKDWVRFEKTPDGEEMPCSDILIGGEEGRENVLVLDEASLIFDVDTQMKDREKNKPIFTLIALCRHVGLDLYFLAQHQGNVDAKLRRLAETRTKCVKTERLPLLGWLIALMPWFGQFLRIVYMGENKTAYARTWHRFDKRVGALYKTHGMRSSVGMRIQGTRATKADDATSRKGKFLVVGALVAFIASGCLLAWRLNQRIAGPAKEKAPVAAAPGTGGSPGRQASPGGSHGDKAGPAQPRKGGLRLMEWDEQDELILAAVVRDSKSIRVLARGGVVLTVGGYYFGELVSEYQAFAGWHYFRTSFGRTVVVRPINSDERKALPPVTIPGKPVPSESPSLPSLGDALGQTLASFVP